MDYIIGRKEEIANLNEYHNSGRPEFVAVYGRRRVGKTYLIDYCFGQSYAFFASGVIEGSMEDQLYNFNQSLKHYGNPNFPIAKNWKDAFSLLRQMLEEKMTSNRRIIVFLDELPCMDTPRSNFLQAIDSFWNTWASKHPEIMLVVCGSATSWMVENLINSHGGLHNRITHEMHIHPFSLSETEEYLKSRGIVWNRLTVAQCYMAMGGIPYYLSLITPTGSLAQNLDHLYFSEDGEMKREYGRLFTALFRRPEKYIRVIESLAQSRSGLTRSQIIKKSKINSGEDLTNVLRNLEYCDFIRSYSMSGKAGDINGRTYQIIDFFTLFYLKFCKKPTTDSQWWSHNLEKSVQNDWFGIMFEILCINHIAQIKEALGISGIYTEYASWRSKSVTKAQIDLVIDRSDDLINICEMKYSKSDYSLDKAEADKLMRRQAAFEEETRQSKGIQIVLITPRSLKSNKYSSLIHKVITLDSLFQ